MKLAERVSKIRPSATMEITAKAKELRAKGIDIIGFGAGEPDFDTPDRIKKAAVKALDGGHTKYTAVGGIDELKQAIADKLWKDNEVRYGKKEILVSCGAKHSLYNASQVLFQEGDEVIIPTPWWVTYPDQITLSGATVVSVFTDESVGFKMSADAFRAAITPRTKGLILNSPCNPTGTTYTREELEAIASIAVEHDIFVISDEIYEKIIYDDVPHVSIASLGEEIKKRTILVNGVSKGYSMTGWRIGYTAAPAEITEAMSTIQSQCTSNPTSIAQWASVEALTGPQEDVSVMAAEFEKRRNYIVDALNSLPQVECFKPSGAFYVFPRISGYFGSSHKGKVIRNSVDLTQFLLEEARIAVVPGAAFEADPYIRISYATSMEQIEKGMERMAEAVRLLE